MIIEFRNNRYRAWHGNRREWNYDNNVTTIVNAKQLDAYRVILIGHNGTNWFVIRKSRWDKNHHERVFCMGKGTHMAGCGIQDSLPIKCVVPEGEYKLRIVYKDDEVDEIDFESAEVVDLTQCK